MSDKLKDQTSDFTGGELLSEAEAVKFLTSIGKYTVPCRKPGCLNPPAKFKAKSKRTRFFWYYCSKEHYEEHLSDTRAGAPARVAAYLKKKEENEAK